MKIKFENKIFIIIIFLIINYGVSLLANEYKIITDMEGNRVEVPVNPQRIATLHGPSIDKIIMLGKSNKIALLMTSDPRPWALKFYPLLKRIPVMKSYMNVDIEDMLNRKIDLVFYSYFPQQAERLKLAGIKIANAFDVQNRPKNMSQFMDNFKRQVLFFGEVLGPDAKKRAEKYCIYFDKKITAIINITSKIAEEKKPKVYWGGRQHNLFYTQGKDTVMQWYTELAGGIFITRILNQNYPEVTMEQILLWDPEIILISSMYSTLNAVRSNPNWETIKAVRDGKLYLIPTGISAWDFASGESILMGIYLAKKFHPALFKNWDMIEEMKTFYSEIYNLNVTSQDAERILQCLPPI